MKARKVEKETSQEKSGWGLGLPKGWTKGKKLERVERGTQGTIYEPEGTVPHRREKKPIGDSVEGVILALCGTRAQ